MNEETNRLIAEHEQNGHLDPTGMSLWLLLWFLLLTCSYLVQLNAIKKMKPDTLRFH